MSGGAGNAATLDTWPSVITEATFTANDFNRFISARLGKLRVSFGKAIQLKPVRSTSVEVARWKTMLAFYSNPLKRFMTTHFFSSDEAQNTQQRCPIRALGGGGGEEGGESWSDA